MINRSAIEDRVAKYGSSPKELVILKGVKDSSEILKNYKELKVWQNPLSVCIFEKMLTGYFSNTYDGHPV